MSDEGGAGHSVVPTPLHMEGVSEETINIQTGDWKVVRDDPRTETAANYLAGKERMIGITIDG